MLLDVGLLFLRVSAGLLLMLGHGYGKLVNFSAIAPMFPDPLGMGGKLTLAVAVLVEFFCSLFVVLGLSARWAAIPIAIQMFIVTLIVHAPDPFVKKELALLFAIIFTALAMTGPGALSLDGMMKLRRSGRP